MERRGESGMETAERRALSARVEALERRVAMLEAERAEPIRPAAASGPERPGRDPESERDAERLRRIDSRTPRQEGASLRRLGVTRRSEGAGLLNLVRATVLIAIGFLVALGVGWVVIVSQPGAGSGWSDAFGGSDAVPEDRIPVDDGGGAPGEGSGSADDGGGAGGDGGTGGGD